MEIYRKIIDNLTVKLGNWELQSIKDVSLISYYSFNNPYPRYLLKPEFLVLKFY